MSDLDPSKMKVDELRAELRSRGLSTSGLKAVLVKRLQKALEDDDEGESKPKEATGDDEEEEAKVGGKRKSARVAAAKKKAEKIEEEEDDSEEEEEEDSSEDEAPEPPVKKKKTGAKVDSVCPLSGAKVHEDYDCMLNQTNIAQNNNKFYVLQLLEKGGSYYVWTRWGRVGERGAFKNMGPMGLDKAVKDFEKKFKDKSANNWAQRANFKHKAGKYTLIEMDDDDEDVDEIKDALVVLDKNRKPQKVLPSALAKPTQDLMKLIFDNDMFKQTMEKFQIDTKKMPLGKISKQQIQRGYEVLEEIEEVIKGNSRESLNTLWSRFYTLIPHSFGRAVPPILRDLESVQQKKDMLNVLGDIEIAQSLTAKKDEKKEEELETVPNPIDVNYAQLKCKLEPVERDSDDYKVINTYLKNTMGYYKLDIVDAFYVDRDSEGSRFSAHDEIEHRKLLWHGTNVAVVAAILSSGLRIMPHSGGRVGKGIYFASENEKSAGYVGKSGNIGIMFLNEVALGKEWSITRDDCSLKQAPKGYDSIVARGRHEPDPAKDTHITIDGKKVIVPVGKPINMPEYQNSSFDHSEYLVYKESQNRIRFLLKLRWN